MTKSKNLNKIFNATPLSSLLILTDAPHFTILRANTAYLKITGKKEDELEGKSIFEFFQSNAQDYTGDIISDLRQSLLTAISTGAANTMSSVKHYVPINEENEFPTRYWDLENTPIPGNNGKTEIIIHSLIDVTEKKLHQQKQQELTSALVHTRELKRLASGRNFSDTVKVKKKKDKWAADLLLTANELIYEKKEEKKRAAALVVANKELLIQTREKGKRAAALVIANQELVFQNSEKKKRAAELVIADKELLYQKKEKLKKAAELTKAYKELALLIEEKGKRAAELIIANIELGYQNEEKEKRAAELIIANKELFFQNSEKEIQAVELISAYKKLAIQNKEKENYEKENKKDEEYIGHLAAIVECSDDAIISKSLDGIIKSWNKGSEKMFGYSVKEAIGKHISLIIPPKYMMEDDIISERILHNEIIEHFETVRHKKSGEQFYVSLTVSPLKDRLGSIIGISKIIRNISFQKKSEAELIHAYDKLAKQNAEKEKRAAELLIANKELAFQNDEKEKRAAELLIANKELEQFAFIASHDLQQPLRTVANYMKVFEEDYLELLDDNARKYLHSVNNATKRMSLLIKSLLEFSRLGRNTQPTNVDCARLVDEVIADLEMMIKSANAIIEVTEMPQLNLCETEVRQLFQNLITNAIKFRKKNVPLKIQISSEKMNDLWKFSISDNGIGITPADFERVFEIFQRLHTNEEYEGSGIGLANCKKIAHLHHGEIWIEPKDVEGTTFCFTLANLII